MATYRIRTHLQVSQCFLFVYQKHSSVSISSHSVSVWLSLPVFCMFHKRMAIYENVNSFAGVPMFLICVLKTFKYLYNQPFSLWFHTRTANYRNVNPFTAVPMFLICVLETFKCFYKQPFSFCLVKFACFLYVSHTHCYIQNKNSFAGVPMFLICVLETFKCFYKQPFSFLFHTRTASYRNMNPVAGVPMFLIFVLETFKCFYKQPSIKSVNRFGSNDLSICCFHGNLQMYEPIHAVAQMFLIYY